MYQVNPLLLEISTRTLLKKRKLYTPDQWRSMMGKLQSVGKQNGGLHSADEYGRRMIAGQKIRGQKLAKKYGRELSVYQTPWSPANGSTFINPKGKSDVINYASNPIQSREQMSKRIRHELNPNWDTNKTDLTRRQIRKQLRSAQGTSKPLSQAEILSHEMDEYSLGLQGAKKLGLSNADFGPASGINGGSIAKAFGLGTNIQSVRSSHNPGVLDREAKRIHQIHTLYGRNSLASHSRDAEQFAKNKKKFVYNHPETKKYVALHTKDPALREKSTTAALQFKNQQENAKLNKIFKSYGFHKMNLTQVEAEYNRLINRKTFSAYVKQQAEKKGIKRLVPDPDFDPSETSNLFDKFLRSSSIPEGYMLSDEYKAFSRQLRRKWDDKRYYLGKYMDMLEKKASRGS